MDKKKMLFCEINKSPFKDDRDTFLLQRGPLLKRLKPEIIFFSAL